MTSAGGSTLPAIEVVGLRKSYDGRAVVRDLSFRVGSGEIVALLGPNGAGKTTTLLTAGGVLTPIGGDVKVFGRSVASRPMAFLPWLLE